MTYHVQFLLLVLAGWVNRQQQDVIDYLQEENRVLRAGLRGKRLRLSDDERRRLAVKAQALGREALAQIASVATPAHWGAIAATDLFTVEVVNPFGLVRYHVLFVIDIATRCVCIGGITSDPNGEWMKQVARNLTDMWDGFLLGKRYLIHDRDPLFTEAVRPRYVRA